MGRRKMVRQKEVTEVPPLRRCWGPQTTPPSPEKAPCCKDAPKPPHEPHFVSPGAQHCCVPGKARARLPPPRGRDRGAGPRRPVPSGERPAGAPGRGWQEPAGAALPSSPGPVPTAEPRRGRGGRGLTGGPQRPGPARRRRSRAAGRSEGGAGSPHLSRRRRRRPPSPSQQARGEAAAAAGPGPLMPPCLRRWPKRRLPPCTAPAPPRKPLPLPARVAVGTGAGSSAALRRGRGRRGAPRLPSSRLPSSFPPSRFPAFLPSFLPAPAACLYGQGHAPAAVAGRHVTKPVNLGITTVVAMAAAPSRLAGRALRRTGPQPVRQPWARQWSPWPWQRGREIGTLQGARTLIQKIMGSCWTAAVTAPPPPPL